MPLTLFGIGVMATTSLVQDPTQTAPKEPIVVERPNDEDVSFYLSEISNKMSIQQQRIDLENQGLTVEGVSQVMPVTIERREPLRLDTSSVQASSEGLQDIYDEAIRHEEEAERARLARLEEEAQITAYVTEFKENAERAGIKLQFKGTQVRGRQTTRRPNSAPSHSSSFDSMSQEPSGAN